MIVNNVRCNNYSEYKDKGVIKTLSVEEYNLTSGKLN